LSGYLGDADIGAVILEAVAELRAVHPGAMYCCDPVMGDVGRGVFVRPSIPGFLREQAVPLADVITPNQFEFEHLIGRPLRDRPDAIACARTLGAATVVITSLRTPDVPADQLETLAVCRTGEVWSVRTPFLPLEPLPNGMGDVFTALLLGARLKNASWPEALSHAVSSLYALVRLTEPGSRDLPLVAAQQELVAPAQRFDAEAVSG